MGMEEGNIKTQTLITFIHDALVKSIINSIVSRSSDLTAMESDLEKLTGMYVYWYISAFCSFSHHFLLILFC